MKKISCVIPTHARADMLADAVHSIGQQSHSPNEIIIVDDVDDVPTRRRVAQLQRGVGPPIRYVKNTGAPGASSSRNVGLAHARYDIISFLDDDDVWRADLLERAIPLLADAQNGVVIAAILEVKPGRADRVRSMTPKLTVERFFEAPGGLTGSNAVYRRSVLELVGGFDTSVPVFNDWDLMFRLVQAGVQYAAIDDPLVEWRRHDGPRIGTACNARADGIEAFVDRYREYMPRGLRRQLEVSAVGMRRRCASTGIDRLTRTVELAITYGAAGGMRRACDKVAQRLQAGAMAASSVGEGSSSVEGASRW